MHFLIFQVNATLTAPTAANASTGSAPVPTASPAPTAASAGAAPSSARTAAPAPRTGRAATARRDSTDHDVTKGEGDV